MRIFSTRQGNESGFNSCKLLLYILALHILATIPMGKIYHAQKIYIYILAITSSLAIAATSVCSEIYSVKKNFLVHAQ